MTVTDLIEQAQGLTDKAAQQIELERGEKKARTKHQLDLPAGGSFPLGDGDTLTVLEKKPKITSDVGDAWEGPPKEKIISLPYDRTRSLLEQKTESIKTSPGRPRCFR